MTLKATTMTAGAVAGLLLLAGLAVASGTAGEADASFGTNGLLVGGDGTIWATAVQGDGRIVAVGSEPSGTFVDGTETSAWFIRRYLADGDVDTDFGSSGVVNLFGESTRNERAIDVALDAAGGIVVGGRGSLAVTSGKGKRQTTLQVPYAVVVRLEPDGGLDLDFGDDGYAFPERHLPSRCHRDPGRRSDRDLE